MPLERERLFTPGWSQPNRLPVLRINKGYEVGASDQETPGSRLDLSSSYCAFGIYDNL